MDFVNVAQNSGMTEVIPFETFHSGEKLQNIFDTYVTATVAFDSGLISGAEYILLDLLKDCEKIYTTIGAYHKLHMPILEQLSKVYLSQKKYDEVTKSLERIVEIDPDSIRAYYRLYQLQSDSFADEKKALSIYLKACEAIKRRGKSHPDYTIFKSLKTRGEVLRKKRSSYLILENDKEEIDKQNLFNQLPIEIIAMMMEHLNQSDMLKMLIICKGWRSSILASPYLISLYAITGELSSKKLSSYLRIFDQLSPISEIMLNYICLDLDYDVKLLKLLLSSKLCAKWTQLGLSGSNMKSFEKILMENKDSRFIKNLQKLTIKVLTTSGLNFCGAFLHLCNNLEKLEISLNMPRIDESFNVNMTEINLLCLVEFSCSSIVESRRVSDFFKPFKMENVTNLTLAKKLGNNLLMFLQKCNRLQNLIFSEVLINDAMSTIFDSRADLRRLESLTLRFLEHRVLPTMSKNENNFPCLKYLRTVRCFITNHQFMEIYTAAKDTLESIELKEETLLDLDPSRGGNLEIRHNLPIISLKHIFSETPKLEKFVLKKQITSDIFSKMIIDIATASQPMRIKYFELESEKLSSQDFILMLLTTKGKLFIDTLALHGKYDAQLKEFLDKAVLDKSIKKYTYTPK